MNEKSSLDNLNAQLNVNDDITVSLTPNLDKPSSIKFDNVEKLYDIVLFSPAVIDKVASVMRERAIQPFSTAPLKTINKYPAIQCVCDSKEDDIRRYYGARLTFAVVGYFSDGVKERWILRLFYWSDNAAVKGRIPNNIPGAPVELYLISSYNNEATPSQADIINFNRPLLIDGIFGGVYKKLDDDKKAIVKNDDGGKKHILLNISGKTLPGVVRDYYAFLDSLVDRNIQRADKERMAKIAFSRLTAYEKQIMKILLHNLADANSSQEEFILKLIAPL